MLTSSDIARVLTHYDLGTAEGIAATGHGFVNETVVVATARGRFVIRRNHRRFSLAAIQYRHQLINALCRRSFPTARLIPTRTGDTVAVVDGRVYETLEYISGTDFDVHRPEQITATGAILASYHRAVGDCAAPVETPAPRYAPSRIPALSETLYERDVMGELHDDLAWYDARAAALRAALPDAMYANLPCTLIHGDVHPDNLKFCGDRVVALLDFDQVEYDARIVDLADALVGCASAPSPAEALTWGVFRGPLNQEAANSLIAGYCKIAPLSPGEIEALPILIEVLWLRSELGRVISTPEGAPEYHRAVLDQGKRLSNWMQHHNLECIQAWNEIPVAQNGVLAA